MGNAWYYFQLISTLLLCFYVWSAYRKPVKVVSNAKNLTENYKNDLIQMSNIITQATKVRRLQKDYVKLMRLSQEAIKSELPKKGSLDLDPISLIETITKSEAILIECKQETYEAECILDNLIADFKGKEAKGA